jgi:hypothetical protein
VSLIDLASHVQAAGLGVMGETLFIQHEINQTRPVITLRQTGGAVDSHAPGLARAESLITALSILHSQIGSVFVLE